MPPSLYFQHFLAFCHDKTFLVLLIIFLSQPKKTPLFQGFPFLLFREWYLEITIYTWSVLVGPGISLFLGPLSGQSWKKRWIYANPCRPISVFISVCVCWAKHVFTVVFQSNLVLYGSCQPFQSADLSFSSPTVKNLVPAIHHQFTYLFNPSI